MHQPLRKDDTLSMSTRVLTINYATDATTVAQDSDFNSAEWDWGGFGVWGLCSFPCPGILINSDSEAQSRDRRSGFRSFRGSAGLKGSED